MANLTAPTVGETAQQGREALREIIRKADVTTLDTGISDALYTSLGFLAKVAELGTVQDAVAFYSEA